MNNNYKDTIYTCTYTQNRNTNKRTITPFPPPHPPTRRKHSQLTHLHNTHIVKTVVLDKAEQDLVIYVPLFTQII